MNFVIYIDTIPQNRPRFFKGRAIDPPQCKKFKQDLAKLVSGKATLLTDNLKVDLKIFRDTAQFKSATSRRYGDIDNLAKGILDACNGVIWKDDSQIVDLHVTKNLAELPRIEISVEEIVN